MTPLRLILGVSVGIAAATTLVAQNPASQKDLPTFRGGVQLIDVDVVVTGKDGKPVRGLTQEDFEIIEDNRPQQIRTFSIVDLPFDPPTVLAERRARATEPDVVTNTAPEGRTYVLLIDKHPAEGDQFQGGPLRARHVLERWLDEVVQPNDRVAIVHTDGSFTHAQGLTNNRRLILDSINRTLQVESAATSGAPEAAVQAQLDKWRAIKDISERLGTIPGRRKAIVWFAFNVDLHPTARLLPRSLGGSEQPTTANLNDPVAAASSHILAAWREAAQAAVNNNVAIYPVDSEGLTTRLGLDVVVAQASLREVAAETGGIPIVNTSNFSDMFAKIVQDASSYYLLGYSPEPRHNDGDFHPITVRVRRPDVTVRARRGYYAPGADAKPPKPLPVPPKGVSIAARDALHKPVAVPGLGIDVSTVAFKGPRRDRSSVVITAHVRGQTLDFAAGRRLAISYQVFDVEGKVATGFYKVFGFNLGSESKALATGAGLQFVERITLKPGRYELRLVAEQPDGPIGSVVAHVDAAKFDDSLELSGVALATRRTSEVLLVGDRPLRSVLPGDATARRAFGPAGSLTAYAEIYTKLKETAPGRLPEAQIPASLAATIVTRDGSVVAREQAKLVTEEPADEMLRRGYRVDFDLSRLTPGPYVLTLEARSPQVRNRIATRQIPFTIQ